MRTLSSSALVIVNVLVAVTVTGLFACAHPSDAGTTDDSDLIGGDQVTDADFPATLLIRDNCTAAKIGPRHILTAAHCVTDFQYYGAVTISASFAPLASIQVTNQHELSPKRSAFDFVSATIEQTFVHPSWLATAAQGFNLGAAPSADVALIVLRESSELADFAAIPTATVDTAPVDPNAPLTIMGYGCETGLNAGFDYTLARLKAQDTRALSASAALVPGRQPEAAPGSDLPANYFFTPGAALPRPASSGDAGELLTPDGGTIPDYGAAASLCPGDSGGPVYRNDGTQRVIVGVNAYYNFSSNTQADVSLTNWHTRLDLQAKAGVGAWLQSIVETGAAPDEAGDAGAPQSDASF